MSDVNTLVFQPLNQFFKNSLHLVKKCNKPDRKEFARIAGATSVGFLMMGFIGFFVKLVHIPINNILVTPEQEERAARLESERLRHLNGNPLTVRAFAADQKLRQACPSVDTLLHTAVLHGRLGAVQLLLQHGASPLVKLPDNKNLPRAQSTLESTAPRTSNFRYSLMLDAAEGTPLHYACAAGQLEILKLLLSCASTLNDIPKRWRPGSLLLWAITSAQPRVVEFLVLQSRLEADCFDEDGNNSVAIAALVLATPETPERFATLKTILQLLLRRDPEDGGVDVNHKNMHGLTAFDVAETPASKQLLGQLGVMTARIVPVERVLQWDRDRFRDEIEYLPLPGRRRVILRDQSSSQDN
uniref:Protein transport protein Sec61 subunit gamma n=1 Tax=Phytophthora ramorum TaxID=164328 RepID=H3HDP0_PHYRM